MIKFNATHDFLTTEANVESPRSFQYQYALAKQTYEEILTNLELIIAYGNMSIEEMECFIQSYENPYIEKCRRFATPAQHKEITLLQKEIQQRLHMLFVTYHPILKQIFLKQLQYYIEHMKGSILAHFCSMLPDTDHKKFFYLFNQQETLIWKQYQIDEQGEISVDSSYPEYEVHLFLSGIYPRYRKSFLLRQREGSCSLKDISLCLQDTKIILASFSFADEKEEHIAFFQNRFILKRKKYKKYYDQLPYVYTEEDDLTNIVKKSIQIFKEKS